MIRSWLKRFRGFVDSKNRSDQAAHNQGAAQPPSLGEHDFTLTGLNLEAARRQAKIGKGYARNAETKNRLAELKRGVVTLPPHKSWTGDYTDWTADPFTDRNWRFQYYTLRWINPLLWDALDGNTESESEWKRIVRSWSSANTPPERAADTYAWTDMTDGNRAIQISLGAPLITEDDDWYIDLLVLHRDWLCNDQNIVPGNHGLHQNLGLFVVAAVLNDDLGVQRAIHRLGNQILEAFDEGGLNEEGSVGYHQMNLVWWTEAKKRLSLEGKTLSQAAARRLEKAGETLGVLLLPDGTMPQIGDGNRGTGRQTLHPLVRQVSRGEVKAQDLPTFHHYDNGFTVFRSGWGHDRPLKQESHTIIRHGRDLLRHSHNDRGSVHLYNAGRRWITDGGFHSYQQRDPDRQYTKSRLAHSLVDLPEQQHDITGDVPVLLTESTDELHSIELLDDNFESAHWKRRITYLRQHNIWIIWDRIFSQESTLTQQQWLVDLDIAAVQSSNRHVELRAKNSSMHMYWLGDQPTFDVVEASPSSGDKRGLIGVRWKKMKPGVSIHAKFHSAFTNSVVILSPRNPMEDGSQLQRGGSATQCEVTFKHDGVVYSLKLSEKQTTISGVR